MEYMMDFSPFIGNTAPPVVEVVKDVEEVKPV